MAISTFRITAAVSAALGAAAVGLAVSTAGTASAAASADDAFLTQVKSVDITFDSPPFVIGVGHAVCSDLATGVTGTDLVGEITTRTELTPEQAAHFVVYAARAYCPQYAGHLT
jgi:hypothetical protein